MPAYRERIYICPMEHGHPGWIVDFPLWWDRRAFFEKYGDRRLDTGNPFQVEYALLMTAWEANGWDKKSREATARESGRPHPTIAVRMGEFEAMLQNASWVIVESYEWESGLS